MAYITSSDIKSYGGIPSTDTVDDTEITLLIARAEAYVEEYTGRVFKSSSDDEATRYFSQADDVDGNSLWLDLDLNAIVTITAGTDTISSSDYFTEPRNDTPHYAITLSGQTPKSWSDCTSDGDYENAISVEGQWAYSSDVPTEIEHAMVRLVRWFYEQGRVNPRDDRPIVLESGVTIMPAQMPADVMGILDLFKKKLVAS